MHQPKSGAAIIAPAGREADDVPVREAVASSDGQVHGLLHEDVARAAAGAEEDAVPEGQLAQAAGGRGEGDAQGTRGGAGQTSIGGDARR